MEAAGGVNIPQESGFRIQDSGFRMKVSMLLIADSWRLIPDYDSVKDTVTVMITGTGAPFSSVGVYSHCLTQSSAA